MGANGFARETNGNGGGNRRPRREGVWRILGILRCRGFRCSGFGCRRGALENHRILGLLRIPESPPAKPGSTTCPLEAMQQGRQHQTHDKQAHDHNGHHKRHRTPIRIWGGSNWHDALTEPKPPVLASSYIVSPQWIRRFINVSNIFLGINPTKFP